jgi:xanthine dehydrogenase iron-sulfur-binding subunit
VNRTINLTINGRKKTLDVDVRSSLLEILRDQLGLTSIKQGCGVGECGSCTIMVDDTPIDSCIYLAVWADGKSIRTLEGESRDGILSAVQTEYVESGAVQCGFCTPGLIMATTSFVEKHKGQPVNRDQIRKAHAGNVCRCTGYQSVITATENCLSTKEEPSR